LYAHLSHGIHIDSSAYRVLSHSHTYCHFQVLARLERQRREWDSKLERIKDQDRVAREKSAIDIRVKSGEQLGTTASLGDKVSANGSD
jgi:hypothetical protein